MSDVAHDLRVLADRAAAAADQTRRPPLRILTDVEIEAMPKPEWLIDNMIPVGALAVLYGPPGAGKSFAAVSMALSVATGFRYFDNAVQRGPVVYIAPEGGHGMGARVAAWKAHHGFTGLAGVHFIPATVSLLEPSAVQALIEQVTEIAPVFVFVDTLARSLPGGDENSATDMGNAIQLVDRIREELTAAVMLVHHTNAGGERERGSTALRGAADVMLALTQQDGCIVMECAKQKDAPAFNKLELGLLPVADSAVITARSELQLPADAVSDFHRKILWSLRKDFLEEGASATEWQKATGVQERRFYEARTWLYNMGYVTRDKKGRGAKYTMTDKGTSLFTAVTADNCGVTATQRPPVTAAERGSLRTPQLSSKQQQEVAR
jgi:hypothetical protein